jgi:sulfur relay (sulfurtransferase) complex TusBCD TusD component (DsrE family)
MARILITLCEAPYGKQRFMTAYRFAMRAKTDNHDITMLLLEDATGVTKKGQVTTELPGVMHEIAPNCEELLKAALKAGIEIWACGTCFSERGFKEPDVIEGVKIINIGQFVDGVIKADKIVNL